MRKTIFLMLVTQLLSTSFLFSQNQIKKEEHFETDKSVRDSSIVIDDSTIIVPESMNKSIRSLLENWQIDFSVTENNCEKGVNIVYSDSVYMQRLYNLPTEMELSFNSVVRSYIDMYTGKRRELVSYMLSLGEYYYPMFEEALDRYDLPLELKYLPVIESALNPVAVSRMGATGLWQFMLRTGKEYNLEVNSLVDERRDPYKSTEAAARYLNDLHQIYEDWNLVIAAYNCGPGNVNRAIARSGGKRDYWDIYYNLPRETRGYVPVFIAANYVMNYNDAHKICHRDSPADYMFLDTVHVTEEIHFRQISEVLDIPIEDIRRYNPQFKRDLIPGNYKPYALVLPTNKMYAFISKSDEIINHNKTLYLTHRKQTLSNEYDGTVADGNVINTYYRIKKGDTLGAIARRNSTTVGRLQRMNGMKTTKLSIGQRLIVEQTVKPMETQQASISSIESSGKLKNTYYRVKRGDTLGALARRNKTTVTQLQRMNGLNSTKLAVGKSLIVKQERIEVESENTEKIIDVRKKYPKIKSSSLTSSESIITEYIDKCNQEKKANQYEVTVL